MSPSDVALYAPGSAPQRTPVTRVEERLVDLLILTTLKDELAAVLALGEEGRAGWQAREDRKGFRLYRRTFPSGRGTTLTAPQNLERMDPEIIWQRWLGYVSSRLQVGLEHVEHQA